MTKYIKKHIKTERAARLPEHLRLALKTARLQHGWSQTELGQRLGLPQMHISGIESGKIVPRYNTLLEIARTLGFDLMLVPRQFIPIMQSIIRDTGKETENKSLYAVDEDTQNNEEPPHDEV